MATPVFKFNHPKLPDEDLYFIQNTFFELPETIPMDLTTFVEYHLAIDRTLAGFFSGWNNLQLNGSSLEGVLFDNWFNDAERKRILDDAEHSGALLVAEMNSDSSIALKNFIENREYENNNVLDFFYCLNSHKNFRDLDYYLSWHHLYNFFWENNIELDNERYLLGLEDAGASYFIDLHKQFSFPLIYIPHRYRSEGYFQSLIIENKQEFLLPGMFYDKELLLHLLKSCYPRVFSYQMGDVLANDRNFILEAVKLNPSAIANAAEHLQDDVEIARHSLPFGWPYISYTIRQDCDFCVEYLESIILEGLLTDEPRQFREILLKDIDTHLHKEVVTMLFERANLPNIVHQHLDTSIFRNGDKIRHAQSAEDWRRSNDNREPAWCYLDERSNNRNVFGKIYNGFAVLDERNLAPLGCEVLSLSEFVKFNLFKQIFWSIEDFVDFEENTRIRFTDIFSYPLVAEGMRSSDGRFDQNEHCTFWVAKISNSISDDFSFTASKQLYKKSVGLFVICKKTD